MSHPLFPIEEILPALRESLIAHPRLVLEAPPGAGKTTHVNALQARWQQQGRDLVRTREPGGTDLAEALNHVIGEGR